jgi:para-nitrobenzyl esterase
LNVWTPGLPPGGGGRPVLFFIHGGANVAGASNTGDGAGNLYDGAALAVRENAVVVTINYRLGALGFLAHPALAANGVSGNWAILDQVQALSWVQRNIAAFGGDPTHVMVFGESAGAFNTCMMLTAPLAHGLFSSALMESGYCPSKTKALAEQQGSDFATKLGCTDPQAAADCLRGKTPQELLDASPSLTDVTSGANLMPVATVDGQVFPDAPMTLLKEGKHAQVPFAIGSNRDEMAFFLASKTVPACTDYQRDVQTAFGALAAQVLEQYPCAAYPTPKAAEVDLYTDLVFTCPTRQVARAMASTSSVPVHRYYFTHVSGGSDALLGAYHTAELRYVFGTFAALFYTPSPDELTLSHQIQDLWGNLATSGDPNQGAQVTTWPRYDASTDEALVLDTPLSTLAAPKGAKCDFWDPLTP